MFGCTTPRIWTPPLRELTPDTSFGFDLIDFARDVLGEPFDEWQEWLAIHLGELLPDGRPRFRIVLVLVARQNGKTHFARVLTLYWMFVDEARLTLGLSATLAYAKEQWSECCAIALGNRWLKAELGRRAIRATIGEECLTTLRGSRYKIAAANRRAGRSLTIHRIISDELREQATFDAWNASYNAMNAVPDGQLVAISNQGDDTAIVLDSLREPAIAYIETGEGDPRTGLFEWSSPAGADPADVRALAMANPNLGRRVDRDALRGEALKAKRAGGEQLAGFRTEVMCMRVALLDPAVDPDSWKNSGSDTPVDLALHRRRVALCLDVSVDGSHASLVAAAVVDDLVHVDVVAAWSGFGCTQQLRRDLPGIVAQVRPAVVGWFPTGPAAVVAADMMERKPVGWPPRRTEITPLKAEVPSVCMAFADLVHVGAVRHANDPMLKAQVEATQRLRRGDVWVFQRVGATPIDGTYAAAGAVHLARTLPPPRAPLTAV